MKPDSIAVLREIDRLCEDFEESWEVSDVSEFITQAEQDGISDVGRLVSELLAIDSELRSRAAKAYLEELRIRHPKYSHQIEKAGSTFDVRTRSIVAKGSPLPGECSSTAQEGPRYDSLRALAKGGLGQVLVADDRYLNRKVAIKKVLRKYSSSEGHQARLIKEARITGSLEHPGIVPIYDIDYENGQPFYCMRLVEGNTLEDLVKSHYESWNGGKEPGSYQRLKYRKLLNTFVDVCNAVDYAHSQDVIHRDLKPQNIMVGKHGQTLVLDWGLAKKTSCSSTDPSAEQTDSGNDTKLGDVVGTPFYMSPEQAKGKIHEVNASSDIYGLGATLFSILTGKFPNASTCDTFLSDEGSLLNGPQQLNANTPRALAAVCLKAMATQPIDRYKTAGEMAEDIERFLAGEKVLAYNEPNRETMARFLRRNKLAMTGITTALFALLAGSLLFAVNKSKNNVLLTKLNTELVQEKATSEKERKDAVKAKDLAEIRAQHGLIFNQFMQDCFLAAGNRGMELKVVDAMIWGMENMQQLKFAPKIQVNLLSKIGATLKQLGDYPNAAKAYQLGLQLIESNKKLEKWRVNINSGIADTYLESGNLEQAEIIIQELLDLSDTSTAGMRIRMLWSKLLFRLGRYREVEEVSKANLEIMKSLEYSAEERATEFSSYLNSLIEQNKFVEAGKHLDEIRSFESISKPTKITFRQFESSILWHLGRHDEAVEISKQVLQELEELHGSHNLDVYLELVNIARLLSETNKMAEAIQLCDKAIVGLSGLVDHDYPFLLRGKQLQATLLQKSGRHQESKKAWARILPIQEAKLGICHGDTIQTMLNLDSHHERNNHVDARLELLNRFRVPMEEARQIELPQVYARLGVAYEADKQFEKTQSYLLESIRLLETEEFRNDKTLFFSLTQIAGFYMEKNDVANSNLYAKKGVALAPKVYPSPCLGLSLIYFQSGNASMKLEEFELAKDHLERAYTTARKAQGIPPIAFQQIASALLEVARKTENENEIQKWKRVLEDLR